jgi:hypothetical protein
MKIRLLFKLASIASLPMAFVLTNGVAENPRPVTNSFSLVASDVWDETGNEYAYFAKHAALGEVIPEVLPANSDLKGNWGAETNGLQLSLRFRRNEYTQGEAIPAIVIFRNLESDTRKLLVTNSSALYFKFLVRFGTNELVLEPRDQLKRHDTDLSSAPSPPQGIVSFDLKPKSERVAVLKLDRIFDLSRVGGYHVSVQCRIFTSATNIPSFEVASGDTVFRIVEGRDIK